MREITRITDAAAVLEQYDVVLFDLDDTIYSEKDYVKSGYAAVAALLPEVERPEEKLWQAFMNGEVAIDAVLHREGLYTRERASACLECYREHSPKIAPYPGVRELLSELLHKRKGLGIITDGRPSGQHKKIAALGIEKLFEKIIITDELGGVHYRKPNPTAFLEMQKHFQVPFGAMVYIGDNPKKDFIAPESLGMGSVWFRNPDGLYSGSLIG